MGHLSKTRVKRNRPPSRARVSELFTLLRRKLVTKEEQATRTAAGEAFMHDGHVLHCSCGKSLRTTILKAHEAGWLVLTKDLAVVKAICPTCKQLRP